MRNRRGFVLWLDAGAWLLLLLMSLAVVWQGAGGAAHANAGVSSLNAKLAMARWAAERLYSSCDGLDFALAECEWSSPSDVLFSRPGRFASPARHGVILAGLPFTNVTVEWDVQPLGTAPAVSGACVSRYGVQNGRPARLTVCASVSS